MQIWPAVDIRSGKCVRLSQRNLRKETVYGESPSDMAIRWVTDGAPGLHILDLDAACDENKNNFEAICRIVVQTGVPIQVAGGIKDERTIEKFLEIGIQRLVIGTRARTDPDWVIAMADKYPGHILLGIDSGEGWAASAGLAETATDSDLQFAKRMQSHPFAGIVFTDIDREGMLKGPDFEAQVRLRDAVSIPVIAAGGIANVDDVAKLTALGFDGCVIGRALYEGRLTLADSLKAAADSRSNLRPSNPFSGASSS